MASRKRRQAVRSGPMAERVYVSMDAPTFAALVSLATRLDVPVATAASCLITGALADAGLTSTVISASVTHDLGHLEGVGRHPTARRRRLVARLERVEAEPDETHSGGGATGATHALTRRGISQPLQPWASRTHAGPRTPSRVCHARSHARPHACGTHVRTHALTRVSRTFAREGISQLSELGAPESLKVQAFTRAHEKYLSRQSHHPSHARHLQTIRTFPNFRNCESPNLRKHGVELRASEDGNSPSSRGLPTTSPRPKPAKRSRGGGACGEGRDLVRSAPPLPSAPSSPSWGPPRVGCVAFTVHPIR